MMRPPTRRSFLGSLAAIPFVARLLPAAAESPAPVAVGRPDGKADLSSQQVFRVRLRHVGGTAYDVHAWSDAQLRQRPLGVSLLPVFRPSGDLVDFARYAETGLAYYGHGGELVLAVFTAPRTGGCPPSGPWTLKFGDAAAGE